MPAPRLSSLTYPFQILCWIPGKIRSAQCNPAVGRTLFQARSREQGLPVLSIHFDQKCSLLRFWITRPSIDARKNEGNIKLMIHSGFRLFCHQRKQVSTSRGSLQLDWHQPCPAWREICTTCPTRSLLDARQSIERKGVSVLMAVGHVCRITICSFVGRWRLKC